MHFTINNSYEIIIEKDIIKRIGDYLAFRKAFIITDERVGKLYLDDVLKTINAEVITIKGYESSKCIEVYHQLCLQLIEMGIKRDHLLIALGGGVIGDLTGFIAATLFRGIDYISIPTTLLSQLDSSIGGKVGINLENAKNMLGSFYQPKMVLIDPNTLNTLPKEEMINGYGELVKHALIGDSKILELDNIEEIIFHSLMVKKGIVERDPYEHNERTLLNFGHTFGHAIEKKSNYTIPHGQAVALGILMIIRLGIKLKVTNPKLLDYVVKIYQNYGLPTNMLEYNLFIDYVKYDKKNNTDTINLVLLKEINQPLIYPITLEELYEITKSEA